MKVRGAKANLKGQNFQSRTVTVGTCRQATKRPPAHDAGPGTQRTYHECPPPWPATRLLAFPMTQRVREEELNTLREQNIAENAGCFLGHRKFAFAFLKEIKSEWNFTKVYYAYACIRWWQRYLANRIGGMVQGFRHSSHQRVFPYGYITAALKWPMKGNLILKKKLQ